MTDHPVTLRRPRCYHPLGAGKEPWHTITTDTTEEAKYLPDGWKWGDGAA